MNLDKLKRSLITHEGVRTKPYMDTGGAITIGVGHNLTANGIPMTMVWSLLEADVIVAIASMGYYPWFDDLDDVRQRVMVEMMFNLGPGRLGEFHRLLSAMHDRDYEAAALEMMRSTWATQVGIRATHLAEMMRVGKDHGE